MQKKLKISAAAVALFLLAVLAVNLAAASTSTIRTASDIASTNKVTAANPISPSNTNPTATVEAPTTTVPANTDTATTTPPETISDVDGLKKKVPQTLAEAEAAIPIRARYLMYTRDGAHIMWGFYGNGHFIGTDNNGNQCWGIYGQGVFAGFYDGEFFWGKYSNGAWKAEYLFGLRYSTGTYVLFPQPTTSSVAP